MRKFETKCDPVKEYIRLLNEHPHTKISENESLRWAKNQKVRSTKLIKTLTAFSTTIDYADRVINMMSKMRN